MKIIIVGMGIAGLTAAITASERGDDVVIVVKTDDYRYSASSWAQGGIVYKGAGDSPQALKSDMLQAASGMTHLETLDLLVTEGPDFVEKFFIKKIKVPFELRDNGFVKKTKDGGNAPSLDCDAYALTREAGHSHERILFSGDQTGHVMIKMLYEYLLAHTGVKILWNHLALDLINIPHHSVDPMSVYGETRCVGLYVLEKAKQYVKKLFADKIILATGGIGQIYKYTTNPPAATGDGIAIAHRAGARVINMEFTQFHPTSLAHKKAHGFLISEALRGEGALLVNEMDEEFALKSDQAGSLMSRDKLSRVILAEQLRTNEDHVYLSLAKSHFDFRERFPNIYKKCLALGINMEQKRIPVTPAFHFSCGGILTDSNGETSVAGLYAVGECACTGVHGANRLASTSLMEASYFAHRAACHTGQSLKGMQEQTIRDWQITEKPSSVDPVLLRHHFETLRSLMWNYVGVIRKKYRLSHALKELFFLKDRVDEYYRICLPQQNIVELRNAVQTAILVTEAAIKNTAPVGSHYIESDNVST